MKTRHLLVAIGLLQFGLADAQAEAEPAPRTDLLGGASFASVGTPKRGFLQFLADHIEEGSGFRYKRTFTAGDRKMVIKVRGPLHKSKLGLGFQIRF